MNIAIIIGNIVRDPEHRATQDGTAVCSFTVAVNRRYKDAAGNYPADFIPCVAWRDRADFVHKYFTKGSPILVVGEMQTRSYTTKSGDKRHITEVIASDIEFVGGKKDKSEQPAAQPAEQELDDFDFTPADDADLPF